MSDEKKGGLALIGGMTVLLLVMLLHPTGHDLLSPGRLERAALANAMVHGTAIAVLPVLLLGSLALTRLLDGPDRLAVAAIVAYATAAAAGLMAATFSGFAGTGVVREMMQAPLSDRRLWGMLLELVGHLNRAFAKVLTVASAAAIVLWSLAMLRRRLGRITAVYGIAVSAITLLAVVSGKLVLDLHGYGLVVLTQAIWFIAAGALLLRAQPPASTTA
jgi:hypothetical protein